MKKFGFLRHHRKIRIEGTELHKIVNKCIKNDITLKDLRCKDTLESTVCVKDEDYSRLRKAAGHSYRITVMGEGGAVPFLRSIRKNIIAVIGAFLLGALIFYQSLFIAEIRVDGYIGLTETELRQTLAEAGIREGERKPDSYDDAKAALYKNHREITWVSIFEDGRLIKVNIAEASKAEAAIPEDKTPVDIVASQSGMIERLEPLKGNAVVREGDYVNKGDVLISGRFKYQSTDYSRGDDFYVMYSHAEGKALARVPRHLEFYMEKIERKRKPTGRSIPGLYIKIGDIEINTAGRLYSYETSVSHERNIIDAVWPLPLKISFVRIEEVRLTESPVKKTQLDKVVNAAVRQYRREEMKEGEEIVDSSIEYSETAGLIKAGVFLEVLEDIGEEKEIKVRKKEKEEEKTR